MVFWSAGLVWALFFSFFFEKQPHQAVFVRS